MALTGLRRDHRVANIEGLNRIYEVSCLPLRPLQRKVLLLPITPQRRGRSGSLCLMIPETVQAILAAIGLYALRHKCLLWRSLAMERSNVSQKLLVRCTMATWPAIQRVRRSRAFAYFDRLVWPRNVPDWIVARSIPQKFKNCR